MNINEAIEFVKNTSYSVPINSSVKYLREETVINIINQIDTQPKVVVPKFVADGFEKIKFNIEDTIWSLIQSVEEKQEQAIELSLFEKWFYDNYDSIQTLINMKQFGYEVEKEQLYTVEIPDPNSYIDYRYLSRNDNGICLDASNDTKWKQKKRNQFTESEIKQDFEWAWDAGFAKPASEEDK